MELDEFTRAYVGAMLWSTNDESTPQGGEPFDRNYDWGDFTDASKARIIADCKAFQDEHGETIDAAEHTQGEYSNREYAGHDFWLTREGHGAGFWDGDWSAPAGDILDQASKKTGEVHTLYVGDDGRLYYRGND